jgi:periplasmic protein TonB
MTQVPRDSSNGSSRRVARQAVASIAVGRLALAGAPYDDPMTKVFALDESSSGTARWIGYTLGAIALMLAMMVGVRVVGLLIEMTDLPPLPAMAAQEVDVLRDDPPPPPPPPEPEAKPEPAPPPRAVAHEPPPPPPAPAQAGKVLTQEPDPNEPVDLTGNTFVSGNAADYVGGVTAANGTGKQPVHAITSPTGTPGGTGPVAAPVAGPDRSRPASVQNIDWNSIGFPPEADVDQVDDALVKVQVDVAPDGKIRGMKVLSESCHGFGRWAQQHGVGRTATAALDHEGNPVASTCTTIIHFIR